MNRYIDADKLKSDIKEVADVTDGKLTEFEVLGILAGQPTADVRENVRGKWIDRGKNMTIRWQCSECGRRDTHIYNFCPDCGADMRSKS